MRDPLTSFEQSEAEAEERQDEARLDAMCPHCQAFHDPSDNCQRERGDDDGVEYADPRDEGDERFDVLMAFALGPRPE